MDITTLGAAVAMAKKVMPQVTSADAGKLATVDSNGKWVAAELDVGQGEVAVDSTLLVTGAAADAKVTGDKVAELKSAFNDLLVYGEDIIINTAVTGYYDLSTGVGNAIGDWTESTGYAQTIIDAKTGDKFKLYGFGSNKPRLWAFLGENDIILSVADAGMVVDSSNPIIITAPIGTLKAAFTIQVSYAYSIKKRIPTYTIADEQINSKLNYIIETKSEEANKQSVMFDLHNVHGYISIDGTITENSAYSIYVYLCGENDSVYFDAPPAGRILQIAVYKDEQTAFTASGLKQYGSSSRDTLPLLASKMNLSTGDFVAIAVENTLPFNYHYHKTYVNGDVVSSAGVLQKILVRKVNNGDIKLSVYVPNEQETNYCRYDFCHYYKKWDELGSATDVVSSDYWNNLFVYDKDNNYIAQGNSNFITLVYGEQYHTGDGHGNEVALFCKFIADGEELNIDNMNVGDIVECSTLRMIQKSNIYKLGGGTANEYDATYPELDENNEPIVNFRHYINMEFAIGNTVKIDNRLEILRDGIKFAQCHGAMLQCYFGDFTDVICNNSESTQNKIASDGTATVASGSSINLRSNGYQPATMAEMFGGDFYIKQTMLNSSGDNSKTLIDFTFYQDRLKCYFMPVSCGADGDVLNTGDFIHVLCERKIDI